MRPADLRFSMAVADSLEIERIVRDSVSLLQFLLLLTPDYQKRQCIVTNTSVCFSYDYYAIFIQWRTLVNSSFGDTLSAILLTYLIEKIDQSVANLCLLLQFLLHPAGFFVSGWVI